MKKILPIIAVLLMTACTFESKINKENLLCREWQFETVGGYDLGYDYMIQFNKDGTFKTTLFQEEMVDTSYFIWTWCDESKTKITYAKDENSLSCSSNDVMIDIVFQGDKMTFTDMATGMPNYIVLVKGEGLSK